MYLLPSLFLALVFWVISAEYAAAVCPVCTVAVGAGLGLSRFLGIDDIISGLWVGGLILSLSLWTADWVSKKRPGLDRRLVTPGVVVAFYLLTLAPLFWTEVIGHPFNTVSLGGTGSSLVVDKLLFGIVAGSIMFIFAVGADRLVRKIQGHQLFIYQKVVFPVVALFLTSLLFYYYLLA